MSESRLVWEPWSAPPVTAKDVREWQEDYRMRLPAILADALVAQNGGPVQETGLTIDALDDFSTLDEEPWAHVFAEGPLAALDRSRLLYIGGAVGCGIVLDYTTEAEPRVLLVHHNLGGELRDPEIASFNELLKVLRREA